MRAYHVPTINQRYWAGIALASVFGTNMGDLYAHDSGLGLLGGLPVLAAIFLVIYFIERIDDSRHDAYYWLCIIVLRTGATNVADYMAGRRGFNIDRVTLSIGFGLLLALLAWSLGKIDRHAAGSGSGKTLPVTDPGYWVTMLTAGIFGTVLGDLCEHVFGEDVAILGLGACLAVALFLYRKFSMGALAAYWLVVAVARTAGTALGDWLAESPHLHLGLPLSTALTGASLAAVLVLGLLWQPARAVEQPR